MTTRYSRQNRDAGLRKVNAITRWAVAGAFAGTGLFAGLATFSTRSLSAANARTRGAGATPAGQSSVAASTNDDTNGFNPATPATTPTVLPAPSTGFTPIVSGAS